MQQPATRTIALPAPRLLLLGIELTDVCNLKCSKCWSQSPVLRPPRAKGYMSQELFQKILDDLNAHHHTCKLVVALSYAGESMLHPKFAEFSKAAAAMGFAHLQLATNGTQLNARSNQVLLENYTQIAVSIHKNANMHRVMEKAKTLFHARRGLVPSIRLNMVAEEFTEGDLQQISMKMRGHCDNIKIFTYITEDMHSAMERLPLWPVCPSMYTYLAVLWNGDTLPCCHVLSPGNWSLGSLQKASLKTIFHGAAYQRLREGQTEGTICHTCEVRR